ncbi:MAG: flagellar hook-length control protein FliK [Gammaproteobacteria bacterium]|nr:flagellar hook-length control protein FliK [Gammaproteobacteria bacterium]
MSEGSSVLLNMGAELATVGGTSPAIAANSVPQGQNSGEFAAILKSTLSSNGKNAIETGFSDPALNMNPLLLTEAAVQGEQLISQDEMELILLPGGKELPSDESKLAWQSVLAEYDSTDPETPRLMVASGDENTYQLEEMTAEELLQAATDQADSEHSDNQNSQKNPQDTETVDLSELQLKEEKQQTNTLNPQAVSYSATQERTASAVNPVLSDLNDANSKISGLAAAESARAVKASQIAETNAQTVENEMRHNSGDEMAQLKQDVLKENLLKSELNTIQENAIAKSTTNAQSNSSSINSSHLGASAYATVSGINGLGQNQPPQSSMPVVANMTINPQNPAWGDVIGDRVHWMVSQNINEAKIRLNPPELGMLEIRVQFGNDQQTSISFSSPHSQVRDVLETSVPRLRELFNENGLNLGNVDVSHHSMSGREQSQEGREQSSMNTGTGSKSGLLTQEPEIVTALSTSTGSGMLDIYA